MKVSLGVQPALGTAPQSWRGGTVSRAHADVEEDGGRTALRVVSAGPMPAGGILWRPGPSLDGVARDGVSISSRGRAAAAAVPDAGRLSSLLAPGEREVLQRLSAAFGGRRDREIGDLALCLAMDKVMAAASDREPPVLGRRYVSALAAELASCTAQDTLHARLSPGFLQEILALEDVLA